MGGFLGKGLFVDKHKDTACVSVLTAGAVALLPMASEASLATLTLATVAAQFGMQFWVGFVAGPTMIHNLERQTFSDIQSKLFPKYGLLEVASSVFSVASMYFLRKGSVDWLSLQPSLLLASLLLNVLNHRLLFPVQITALEAAKAEEDEERKKKLRKKFGMTHGISMLVNVAAMLANGIFIGSAARL